MRYGLPSSQAGDKVVDQILETSVPERTRKKTRINIKKKLMGTLDINNRIKKFVDCRTRDVDRRELYIVEGDSALFSQTGRDAEFQAVMPVRGKILNCLKADYNAILTARLLRIF